ncbi:thioredoxin [Burkholderia gladioli]|nr:thiol reductase thioredoxin [Burkholderia gladioli pv. gladioli]AWY56884.1 thiol reductase thioredoxin [Burkholderia gladioli pv. gladioli]PEH40209.1 thioredoxin [Burkholderia gladioli]QPQ85328.1 thioredoxin [Burkholderia gladioli]
MSSLKDVTEASFDSDVVRNTRPVLVDLWAEWCGPCKALAPILKKVSEQFVGTVDFVKVNVDENASIRDRFGVRGIPTLLLLDKGVEVGRVVGNRTVAQLAKFIDGHLGTATELPTANVANLKAFNGDEAKKQSIVTSLRALVSRKQAVPSEVMWEGDLNGAIQFAANIADIDDCAQNLGIAADVLSIVESLSTYRGTNLGAAQFTTDWLDAVNAGANLSALPGRLLVAALRSSTLSDATGSNDSAQAVREKLITLYDEGSPEVVANLGVAKEEAARIDDPVLKDVLTAASVPLSDPSILSQLLFRIANLRCARLRTEIDWTAQDEHRFAEAMQGLVNEAVARGEKPARGDALLDILRERDPELARRFAYQYFEGAEARVEVGRAFGDALIELTRTFH